METEPIAKLVFQGFTAERVVLQTDCDLTSARKISAAVYQRFATSFDEMPLPRQTRRISWQRVTETFRIGRLRVVERQASSLDPFVKYVFELEDGQKIESVRIPLEKPGRFVVCVSSQVGCAMGCQYCATGRLGLKRNLETWEIVEQVRAIMQELPKETRVHGVVFQGMGEPLANVDRVIAAIEIMHHPCGLSIDQRNITVCTVGIPSGIRKLAASGIRVRLGLSVASAQLETRRKLVPIDHVHTLSDVLNATSEFVAQTGYAPMFAVTPLAGINTSDTHAEALGRLAQEFKARTGVAPRLSLVPYNPIGVDPRTGEPDPFSRASDEEAEMFRMQLAAFGVPVVRRYSGGGDVGAACGQLVAGHQPKERRNKSESDLES